MTKSITIGLRQNVKRDVVPYKGILPKKNIVRNWWLTVVEKKGVFPSTQEYKGTEIIQFNGNFVGNNIIE